MYDDALLVSYRQRHWQLHKVTTVVFYQHASESLRHSFYFKPLTHNEVYCDMIALQYIEENGMNARHSGHTCKYKCWLLPSPHEHTHTRCSPLTSTHSIQVMRWTVMICVVNEGGSADSSTEIHLWLTWMTDWLTGSSQQRNVGQWKSPSFTDIRFTILCVCIWKSYVIYI